MGVGFWNTGSEDLQAGFESLFYPLLALGRRASELKSPSLGLHVSEMGYLHRSSWGFCENLKALLEKAFCVRRRLCKTQILGVCSSRIVM